MEAYFTFSFEGEEFYMMIPPQKMAKVLLGLLSLVESEHGAITVLGLALLIQEREGVVVNTEPQTQSFFAKIDGWSGFSEGTRVKVATFLAGMGANDITGLIVRVEQ